MFHVIPDEVILVLKIDMRALILLNGSYFSNFVLEMGAGGGAAVGGLRLRCLFTSGGCYWI